ncbi:MAG: hypothetical protein GY882_07040, partial [Actinomycetia bacterium]|nr:hypothetical protein [Actinomycetes bacterium]
MTNSTPSPTPVSDDNADALIRSKTTVGAAEEALVALLLSGSDLWPVLDGGLSEDQFATPSLRQVFAAILRVDGSGSAIDPVTVAADLEETSPGCPMGVQELQKLTDTAPRFTNKIETYLNQIAAAATRRALADAGRNIVALAGDQKNKVADALTSAESEVLGLRVAGVRSSATPLSALIPDVLKTLESRKAGELLGLSSGLASLDDANGGLKEQELVIIAARPGMGKSVLALQ